MCTDKALLAFQKNAGEGLSNFLNILPDGGEVDVVLISEQQEGDAAVPNSNVRVGAHHVCHCRYLFTNLMSSVVFVFSD